MPVPFQYVSKGLFRRLTTACEVSEALKLRPEQRDLYRILGIEQESFDVDQKRLEQKYKKLQTVYHPDRYANTSREEQAFSAEASSLVNTAYSTLKAPLDRATYLLARQGFGIDEETESVDNPAFLMEVMEAQEAVNDSDEPEVLQSMKVKYLRRQSDIIQAVSDAFARGDLSSANEGKIHLRYVIRILGAIEEKEEPAWSS
ncbi:hypothetical protein CVIRNUC_005915 [Coccomyxa viridis]|uniref:J domain-containing protein n=1 Tax=Coccomyxa viridis TaxID=1274662 RepID=A0AAV1I9K5_9CHLO|nr:hypothetical protein CVIRNUC_005915 [Coccomyxa viridis]